MAIAAHAVGASEGYIYIRAEYPLAIHRIKKALELCAHHGILGNKKSELKESSGVEKASELKELSEPDELSGPKVPSGQNIDPSMTGLSAPRPMARTSRMQTLSPFMSFLNFSGESTFTCHVTEHAIHELKLTPGRKVWILFKATSLKWY